MKRLSFFLTLIFALGVGLAAEPAFAQATRTWVSGVGDDANPCSRTAPCKTFAGAISKTAVAGEINCIDPGGFGALTITKSVAIICDNVEAGVLVSGTNGISISAGTTDVVYLSGLDFEGLNTSLSGVQVSTVGTVHIVNCKIRGFNTAGINVANGSSGATVDVVDSVVADNAGTGILGFPTGSVSIRMVLNNVRVLRNGSDGIMANGSLTSGSLHYTVRNSESSGNTGNGFAAFSGGADSAIMIDSSSAFNNSAGIAANGSGAVIRFTRSNVSSNPVGVKQVGAGSVLSYGTNSVDGNASNGTFGTTPQE